MPTPFTSSICRSSDARSALDAALEFGAAVLAAIEDIIDIGGEHQRHDLLDGHRACAFRARRALRFRCAESTSAYRHRSIALLLLRHGSSCRVHANSSRASRWSLLNLRRPWPA